jgi:hypothetical protein
MLHKVLKETKQERDRFREQKLSRSLAYSASGSMLTITAEWRNSRDLLSYVHWEREYKRVCEEASVLEKQTADQRKDILGTRR